MTVLIDPPRWPAHGRQWSHLVSDVSLAELHAFADRVGVPRRAFSGDHYDVPQDRYADLVTAGAVAVAGRELLARLVGSGLRVPKRRGEQVLESRRVAGWLGGTGAGVLDLVASGLAVDPRLVLSARAVQRRDGGLLLVRDDDGVWRLPLVTASSGRRLGYHRLRPDGPASAAYVTYVTGDDVITSEDSGELVGLDDPRARSVDAWPLVARAAG